MAVSRLFAPVAAPPPPKPPQLNLVASALMPDVATDTLGPGAAPLLASAGWDTTRDREGRPMWHRPPGDRLYRELTEYRNALVAAVGVMDDDDYKRFESRARARLEALVAAVGVNDLLTLQQAEVAAGVTVDSLPTSVYPNGVARWTGGFAYAPENQYPAALADPCGQTIDLPGLAAPTGVAGVPTTGTGTLPAATYNYKVTVKNANGESLPSAATANIVLSATGEITLTWNAPIAPTGSITGYNVYRNVSGTYEFLASVTSPTYLDNGSATPNPAIVPPTANGTAGPGNYGNLPQVEYVPFLIQVEDECSTWGWEKRDFVGRALRLLDNATPNAIEREFWSGAFAQNTLTGPLAGSNAFLTQSGTPSNGGTGVAATDLTPGSVPSITRGIQILEDYLANTGFGGQGMIHVAPETSPNLLGARRVGSLLLSVMDNIIVPGSGYPTTGAQGPIGNGNATPPAGQAWIFATDLVSVRLDEPRVYPSTMAEAVDRGAGGTPNTVRIRAERFAAASFDVARLAACRVNLAT